MTTPRSPRIGDCPDFGTESSTFHALVEYETGDDASAVWAECPERGELVHPE